MKVKILLIAVLLAAFAQEVSFAQTGSIEVEFNALVEQVNAYIETGNFAAAIPLFKRMHELKPRELEPIEYLGIIYLNLPEERPALTNALFWLTEAEKRGSSNNAVYYNLACYYSLKRDVEKSVMTMNKAFALGFSDLEWMSMDDDLVNFRTSSWWKNIANNNARIKQQLTAFNEFTLIEEEKNITNRITFYRDIVAALKRLAPNVPALQCQPLFFLASSYEKMGNYAAAEQNYLEVKAIQEKVLGNEHPDYVQSLNYLGSLYNNMGNYAKAEKCYLEIRDILEKTLGKDHPDYAISLNNLGTLYDNMGDYAKAERYLLEAVAIREKVLGKEHPDYVVSLNNLGTLYDNMGDYAKAEQYLLEAKAIQEKILGKEHPDYAITLNNLGALYNGMGDYAKAESFHLEAVAIQEKVLGKEHPDYAGSLFNLGELYRSMGGYAKAESYYLEAKAIMEKVLGKDHSNYAALLSNMGVLYDDMGNYEKAGSCYLEARAIREKVFGKEHPDYATSVNNLGALYYKIGDYAKAESCYLEAAAIQEKVLGKELPDYAHSLNNLGVLYNNMGDYAKAEKFHLEAKAIKEKVFGKEHPDYAVSLGNLSGLYLSTRIFDKALPVKQEEIKLCTSLVNRNFSFLSGQQREAYWNANASTFELSYSLSFYHPVPASNILNYDNALFSKGLLLRTTNAVRDSIYASGSQALIAQFEELGRIRQQISALRQSGGNEAYIKSLETQAEALDKSLTQSSREFRELQTDLAVNWQSVQNSLQEKEAAIEFVSFELYDKSWTGKTQYAALVVKPGMNAPVWVPLCEENTLTELFAKLDGKRPREQARVLYDENGTALYNAIWQPLEKTLEGVTTVYYSPSGLLHKVAFSAIPVKENIRLMDVYSLNLVSSTREVVYHKTKHTGKPNSAVVYGGLDYTVDADTMRQEARAYNVPETRSGSTRDLTSSVDTADYQQKTSGEITWGYLKFTDTESRGIHNLLITNKVPANLYSGVKGNKESFMSLNGKKTMVIHLATHGFFNQDIKKNYDEQERLQQSGSGTKAFENPLRRSGLVLAGANTWAKNPVEGTENGILLADEVAGMNLLGAELIVLSACETALGEVDNSEGVFGLQRAFKLAGAQTLIMSLWKVDDEATSILISEFYRNWLSGMSKQEAFKAAQRKVRSDSRHTQPYFWAAFVMMD
jgi:CHAT domain-containing protein/Flp pilus assembly protein TadD